MRLRDLFKIKPPKKEKKPYRVSIYVSYSKSFIERSFRTPERALKYAVNYARGHKPDIVMTKEIFKTDVENLDFDKLLVSRDHWDFLSGHLLRLQYVSVNNDLVMIQLWPLQDFKKILKRF